MKSIIAAVVTCVVLFGASMAVTQYLTGTEDPDAEETVVEAEQVSAETQPDSNRMDPSLLPVGSRPEANVSVEAVLQMTDSIKKMEQQLAEREKRVKKMEQRVNLLFDDLATEQDQVKAFSEGVNAKVDLLNRLTNTLQEKLDELDAKKAELEMLAKQAGQDEGTQQQVEQDRIDIIKRWFSNLQPALAANYLKSLADQGNIDTATSVLQSMPERQTSKILEELNDPILLQQMIQAVRVAPRNQ